MSFWQWFRRRRQPPQQTVLYNEPDVFIEPMYAPPVVIVEPPVVIVEPPQFPDPNWGAPSFDPAVQPDSTPPPDMGSNFDTGGGGFDSGGGSFDSGGGSSLDGS